jgi:hypothetical protein
MLACGVGRPGFGEVAGRLPEETAGAVNPNAQILSPGFRGVNGRIPDKARRHPTRQLERGVRGR